MTWLNRAALAVGLTLAIALPFSMNAYADPNIAVENYAVFGPAPRSDGAQWCGRLYNGYYGPTVYFAQAQIWVNYGGQCNAQWNQPAGTVQVRAIAWSGGSVLEGTPFISNTSNNYLAQAQVSRFSNATMYSGVMKYWDPNGTFTAYARDRT